MTGRDTEVSLAPTGLTDVDGKPIHEGDWITLDGLMTADDSLGLLPNGFMFNEDDVYQVKWDDRCEAWGLDTTVEPDGGANSKWLNHAYGLLNDGEAKLTEAPHD